MKNENVQVTSISLPKEWVKKLKLIAHKLSYEEEREVSYSEVIRRTLSKEFNFKLPKGVKK
jgi:hypothetical protein